MPGVKIRALWTWGGRHVGVRVGGVGSWVGRSRGLGREGTSFAAFELDVNAG